MDTKGSYVETVENVGAGAVDGVRVDELPVGKKVQVRTKNELYTIERREDSLYISGYGYPHLNPWKCRGIGCCPHSWQGGPIDDNLVSVGTQMVFRIDDVFCGEGNHVVHTGTVVEIKVA